MNARFSQSRLLWRPIHPASTNVEAFRRAINRQHPGLNLQNYQDLHAYSVTDYEFWMDLWRYLGVIYSSPPQRVVAEGRSPENPQWFPGAKLNYAENILRRCDDAVACTMTGESGVVTHVTFRKLREMVREMAAAMRASGVVAGDRVAAIATNSIPALVIMLSTASIGGIFTSTAPDMGAKGILDRYRQIKAKILFTETEVFYAGRLVNLMPKVSEVIADLANHGLQLAVLLPSVAAKTDFPEGLLLARQTVTLPTFLNLGGSRQLVFEQLPFDHELFIVYSSGTTGAPKCIVHSAGGILLQTMKDIGFGYGVTDSDTLLQYTTTGWMMWNLMAAGLAFGTRLVLYDGSPLHPSLPAFLRLIHQQGVSVLGISPRFLNAVHEQANKPLQLASFVALRTIVSGGAVLTAPLHEWAQDAFGKQVRVFTGMGGTDICTAFATSVLSEPVYAGEMPCKGLGMKVEVYDAFGNNIEQTGEAGELVCTRPHPSIPLYFWGDISGNKFRDTYYNTYPGVWRQGDYIVVNPTTKGMMILGRRNGLSSRHVPDFIFEVEDIPHTTNGKKIEVAVKQIVSGSNLTPSGAVANPEALRLYYRYATMTVKGKL